MKQDFNIAGKKITVEENIIDRAVRYINPIKANQRFKARTMQAISGAYLGARHDRRQTVMWNTSRGDADADTLHDLPTLRQRSRDLERNAPIATGAINTTTLNVVGTGLKLQSHIDRDILNMTDEEADAWEANTEREFRLWSESHDCDASRSLTFTEHQELAFRQTLVNGDHFVILPRIPRKDNPYTLALQHIEADRISNAQGQANTSKICGGIEKDEYGAPVTYHICNQHPGSRFNSADRTWAKVPAFGSNTNLRNVIHLYKIFRAGQTRGVPYLSPVIETLKQLDKYTEAEIMAAVVSAMLTVFVKSETGDADFAPMDPTDETKAKTTDEDIKLASGVVVGLAPGESIEQVNPLRPNTGFDPFMMSMFRQIGVALELPFEVLIKHFTASYSASRAALMVAWTFFKQRRQWLARHFCQEIYEIWLYEAVAIGRISAPGFLSDPLIRKAYCGSTWIGDAPIQIDPEKEVNASRERIAVLLSTVDEETAFITGGDFETNYPRIKKEVKMFKDLGIQHPAMEKAPQPIAAKQDATQS
ncbi:MAG: phage portal protein [Nitrospinae bacterium]|nr:phage portal protein [Nitrospinota bacterium]